MKSAHAHPCTIPSAFAKKIRSALERSCALNSLPKQRVHAAQMKLTKLTEQKKSTSPSGVCDCLATSYTAQPTTKPSTFSRTLASIRLPSSARIASITSSFARWLSSPAANPFATAANWPDIVIARGRYLIGSEIDRRPIPPSAPSRRARDEWRLGAPGSRPSTARACSRRLLSEPVCFVRLSITAYQRRRVWRPRS